MTKQELRHLLVVWRSGDTQAYCEALRVLADRRLHKLLAAIDEAEAALDEYIDDECIRHSLTRE